jgi:hypothetical protein
MPSILSKIKLVKCSEPPKASQCIDLLILEKKMWNDLLYVGKTIIMAHLSLQMGEKTHCPREITPPNQVGKPPKAQGPRNIQHQVVSKPPKAKHSNISIQKSSKSAKGRVTSPFKGGRSHQGGR